MRCLDLSLKPWSYLLQVVDEPNIKLNRFKLRVYFNYLTKDLTKSEIDKLRFIRVPDRKYLEFACYFNGLITSCSTYNRCTMDIYVGQGAKMETYFPECYLEQLEKGLNKQKFGNKYIDTMLKRFRGR